jgi:hypothetical protein
MKESGSDQYNGRAALNTPHRTHEYLINLIFQADSCCDKQPLAFGSWQISTIAIAAIISVAFEMMLLSQV